VRGISVGVFKIEAMSAKAPILYVEQQVKKAADRFAKLRGYVDSGKPLRKYELRKLMDDISDPLFNALSGISPPEENFETQEERDALPVPAEHMENYKKFEAYGGRSPYIGPINPEFLKH
jgi:hypothetical protein